MTPRGHVLLYGRHLEVSADDAAHVEQLMAVTYVVEASRGQALRQMCGKQEGCEDGQGDVVAVENVCGAVPTALSRTQEDPIKQRNVVKQVRDGKGIDAEDFS